MKRKLSFYKDGNEWYADVPFIPKAHNLMVAGADTFLESISNGRDKVTLKIVSDPSGKDLEGCSFFLKRTKHDFWGGTYDVYDGYSKEPFHTLWLCNVTHFVCGHHPKRIVILQVD